MIECTLHNYQLLADQQVRIMTVSVYMERAILSLSRFNGQV